MKIRLAAALALSLGTPAFAQTITTGTSPSGTAASEDFSAPGVSAVKKLLTDGYEIKTGFADNSGGAYMVLQKATSAYMCHSNPTPTCEKLN